MTCLGCSQFDCLHGMWDIGGCIQKFHSIQTGMCAVRAKGVHGVGNTLRPGVGRRSMTGAYMWAVALDVQGVRKCF